MKARKKRIKRAVTHSAQFQSISEQKEKPFIKRNLVFVSLLNRPAPEGYQYCFCNDIDTKITEVYLFTKDEVQRLIDQE